MSVLAHLSVLAQESTEIGEVTINLTLPGILSLAAGVLILLIPRLLNYIVAIYLIVVGLVLIFDVAL